MSASSLESRLFVLSDALKQTQTLIARLSKYSSELGNVPSDPDTGDSCVQLGNEIHHSLNEEEGELELLRQEAEDLSTAPSRVSVSIRTKESQAQRQSEISSQAAKIGEELKIARIQFRRAQLTAKKNGEAAKRKARELLFSEIRQGGSSGSSSITYGRRKGQDKLTQEELLLNTSNDVTSSLRRTHTLMSAELQRSQFARETLENSTIDLTVLSESYNTLDTLLSSSRSLVSTLIHSQKSDTWYLESAFLALVITIGWLVFRRLLYGPTWWLLFLPLRFIWRLVLFSAQTLLGLVSVVAGAAGAQGHSLALQDASSNIRSHSHSLEDSAQRGKLGMPTFAPDMPAPSIKVGAGGQGAKSEQEDQQGAQSPNDESHTAAKGSSKDRDKAEKKETVLRDRASDEPPNPKKRMWEEPAGDIKHRAREIRDEL